MNIERQTYLSTWNNDPPPDSTAQRRVSGLVYSISVGSAGDHKAFEVLPAVRAVEDRLD